MIKVDIVRGVGGRCLYINEHRVIGPKPLSGGHLVDSFNIKIDDLREAIRPLLLEQVVEAEAQFRLNCGILDETCADCRCKGCPIVESRST